MKWAWLIAIVYFLFHACVSVTWAEEPPFCYDPPLRKASGCPIVRDRRGRIMRSEEQKKVFKAHNACPSLHSYTLGSCPGYVVDHIWPLCAGGCDNPENMQWQTVKQSRAKDRLERILCREARDQE